jgi:alpha-glucosidase
MVDVPIPLEEAQDPAALQQPDEYEKWGRDPERTPMQWDDTTHAGFARQGARPWLPLAADFRARNVAAQEGDPASMLNLFRALTALRRAEPALNRGAIELVDVGIKDVLAYRRTHEGSDGFLVMLNLGEEVHELDLRRALDGRTAELVLSTELSPTRAGGEETMAINGNEGLIIRLRQSP